VTFEEYVQEGRRFESERRQARVELGRIAAEACKHSPLGLRRTLDRLADEWNMDASEIDKLRKAHLAFGS
jgi:hypothetical protein